MIKVNVSKAVTELRFMGRALSDIQFNQSVSRALNHSAAKGKTNAIRLISNQYNIPKQVTRAALSVKNSNRLTLTAHIKAVSPRLSLMMFNPIELESGVSVRIKGADVFIPGAFLQTMKNGHRGVFGRGYYRGNEFVWRKQRLKPYPANDLPITELKTASVPQMLMTKITTESVAAQVSEDFPGRLFHEVNRALSK